MRALECMYKRKNKFYAEKMRKNDSATENIFLLARPATGLHSDIILSLLVMFACTSVDLQPKQTTLNVKHDFPKTFHIFDPPNHRRPDLSIH